MCGHADCFDPLVSGLLGNFSLFLPAISFSTLSLQPSALLFWPLEPIALWNMGHARHAMLALVGSLSLCARFIWSMIHSYSFSACICMLITVPELWNGNCLCWWIQNDNLEVFVYTYLIGFRETSDFLFINTVYFFPFKIGNIHACNKTTFNILGIIFHFTVLCLSYLDSVITLRKDLTYVEVVTKSFLTYV